MIHIRETKTCGGMWKRKKKRFKLLTVSGKTTKSAPLAAVSAMRRMAFCTVAAVSRKTGATLQAVTVVGKVRPVSKQRPRRRFKLTCDAHFGKVGSGHVG